MLYYDKRWCKIYYHEDIPCVHLDWSGFVSGEKFRETCDAALELLQDKRVDKVIADNSKAKLVPLEDQQWMKDEWFPKAYKAGYRTSAIVESENIFNEVSVKSIVNKMDDGKFTVQYFHNLDRAKQWLKDFGKTETSEKDTPEKADTPNPSLA